MKLPVLLKVFGVTGLLAVTGLVVGCDFALDVEIPLPPHESRLVVNALFETDSTLAVHLGRSLRIGQSGTTSVQHGRVALYVDEEYVEHLRPTRPYGDFPDSPVFYVSDHVMQPGRSYRVEAEADGLQPVVAEERTLPLPSFEVVSVTPGAVISSLQREHRVVLRIFDEPGPDYYHLMFRSYIEEAAFPEYAHFIHDPFRSDDPVLQDGQFSDVFDLGAQRYVGTAMFSDAAFDGQAYTLTVDVMLRTGDERNTVTPFLRLDAVSEPYYRYVRARQTLDGNRDNPFAEPTSLPSNVAGGLGIFAGRSGRNVPLYP